MKKSDHTENPIPLDDVSWEDNPLVKWITDNGRYLLWAGLALLVAIVLIYRISSNGNSRAEKDYAEAENTFALFLDSKANATVNQEALTALDGIMTRQPELHAKYDAPIAQTLINRGDVAAAKSYAERALAQVQAEESPLYTDYAQTTLVIGQKDYKEALKRSINLQQRLEQTADKDERGVVLIAYNIWRTAQLQKELGLKEDELKTWQLWKKFYEENRSSLLDLVITTFSEGQVTLMNYIEARESILQK